ncbi:MAG: PDZ domain-containing protein [Luteimonas sp.]|nr:PDZ domain-containing protein [Luteimonas sp.]
MSVIRGFTLLACLAFPGLLLAADKGGQVEAEVDAALLHLAERGALGRFDQPLTISRPARVRYELGAVVDVRKPDPRGLEVLAITPDGAAARMGLKAGDRLLAINDRRLDGATAANVLVDAVRDSDGAVQLLAARGKSRIELSGHADTAAVPAYQLTIGEPAPGAATGCGYVSYSATPPGSQGLFETLITRVDGRSTPPAGINLLRVPAGRHVLTVQELIPEHRLSASQNLQRGLMRRQLMARAYKPLVVDVRPDTDYRIGARLHKDRLDRESVRANEYWEPVVWEQRAIRCQ